MNFHNPHQGGRIITLPRLLGALLSPYIIDELFEPMVKFILDMMTILLLGVTFLTQGIYLILSFNSVILGVKNIIYKCMISMTSFIFFYIDVFNERHAIHTASIHYFLNIIYIKLCYGIQEDIPDIISFSTCFAMLYITKSMILSRIELQTHQTQNLLPPGSFSIDHGLLFLLWGLSLYTLGLQLSITKGMDAKLNYLILISCNIDQYFTILYTFIKQLSTLLNNYHIDEVETEGILRERNGVASCTSSFIAYTAKLWNFYEFEQTLCYHILEIARNLLYATYHICYLLRIYSYHRYALQHPVTGMMIIGGEEDKLIPPNLMENIATLTTNLTSFLMNTTATTIDIANTTTANTTATSSTTIATTAAMMMPWSWFHYILLIHNILYVSAPLKKCFHKLYFDAYIEEHFPSLSIEDQAILAQDNCSVCLTNLQHDCVRLPCQHVLHRQCLFRILHNAATTAGNNGNRSRCPLCRADIHVPREIYRGTQVEDNVISFLGRQRWTNQMIRTIERRHGNAEGIRRVGGLNATDMINVQLIFPLRANDTNNNNTGEGRINEDERTNIPQQQPPVILEQPRANPTLPTTTAGGTTDAARNNSPADRVFFRILSQPQQGNSNNGVQTFRMHFPRTNNTTGMATTNESNTNISSMTLAQLVQIATTAATAAAVQQQNQQQTNVEQPQQPQSQPQPQQQSLTTQSVGAQTSEGSNNAAVQGHDNIAMDCDGFSSTDDDSEEDSDEDADGDGDGDEIESIDTNLTDKKEMEDISAPKTKKRVIIDEIDPSNHNNILINDEISPPHKKRHAAIIAQEKEVENPEEEEAEEIPQMVGKKSKNTSQVVVEDEESESIKMKVKPKKLSERNKTRPNIELKTEGPPYKKQKLHHEEDENETTSVSSQPTRETSSSSTS